jgi:hypothetical protein
VNATLPQARAAATVNAIRLLLIVTESIKERLRCPDSARASKQNVPATSKSRAARKHVLTYAMQPSYAAATVVVNDATDWNKGFTDSECVQRSSYSRERCCTTRRHISWGNKSSATRCWSYACNAHLCRLTANSRCSVLPILHLVPTSQQVQPSWPTLSYNGLTK